MKTTVFWGLLISIVAIAPFAQANPPNQSDITGTNIFNSVAPDFDSYQLDAATRAEASRLSESLNRAYGDCLNSVDRVQQGPRRFALGNPSSELCISPECQTFRNLLQQTRAFLSENGINTEEINTRVW
jgi:hypothetical protein